MKFNPIFRILLITLALTAAAHAQETPFGQQETTGTVPNSLFHDKQKAENLFFDASRAKVTDNATKALQLYGECVAEDPSNDAAWYELALLYYNQNDAKKAIECAEKAYNLDPANKWYALSLAGLYANNSQFAEAVKIYRVLVNNNPAETDYAFELANTWLQMDKPDEAIAIYNQLEERFGITEEFSMQKHRIYLAMGKDKKAMEELEILAAANPADSRILSLLAEFYLIRGYDDKALQTYQQIQKIDPENPYINISLADYYRKKGDLHKATESLKAGFANPYLDANTKVQVLMTYFSQLDEYEGIRDDLTELSRILSEVHPNEPRVLMLRGEILMMNEDWAGALEAFKKVNELDPGKYQVWENILRILAINDDIEALADQSSTASELFPVQPLPYYFNGYANYQLKQYDKASRALSTGMKFVVNDNAMLADFYSLSGDVYHAAGKDAEAFASYESALRQNPDNAAVLNNYAYYLSLKGEQLARAAEMAEKANKLSPDNPTYLDTWAWVYYKSGNCTRAAELMERVVQLDNNPDATVLEHYGDVLYKLGKTSEALQWWQKAKAAGEGSQWLDKKINNGELYE